MANNNTKTVKRVYGKERTLGDIIYNPATKSVFCSINLGFFGKTTVTLVQRADEAFDIMKSYIDNNGQEQVVCIGKTFPAKRQDQTIIDGVTKGTLGLLKKYDKEKEKEVTDNSDALFITTHRLRESKVLGNTKMLKVGYISGVFGIEIEETESNGIAETNQNTQNTDESYDDIDESKIPF